MSAGVAIVEQGEGQVEGGDSPWWLKLVLTMLRGSGVSFYTNALMKLQEFPLFD